ncbi:MAG: hypothetical protein ACREIJ_07825 [Nitrospiraceae bacterium]
MLTPEEGTPQGGIVAPILANVYLHRVLDQWFEDEVKSCPVEVRRISAVMPMILWRPSNTTRMPNASTKCWENG